MPAESGSTRSAWAAARCPRRRPGRCGGCCARTGTSTAARRCATGWSPSSRDIFDVTVRPSAETADAIYDQLAERLATDAYRPRALYERFGIAVLATTDDPSDDLSAHAALAADPTWSGRVIPTFRPGPLPRAGPARLARRGGRSSARPRTSTPATTRATCGRWRRAGGTSSSTARSRPTTATSTSAPTRWSRARRRGSTGRRWPPTRREPRPPRSAGTCCWRWPGCRATTGW